MEYFYHIINFSCVCPFGDLKEKMKKVFKLKFMPNTGVYGPLQLSKDTQPKDKAKTLTKSYWILYGFSFIVVYHTKRKKKPLIVITNYIRGCRTWEIVYFIAKLRLF